MIRHYPKIIWFGRQKAQPLKPTNRINKMQPQQEKAKVQAFYYSKIAEGMSHKEARSLLQISDNGEYWTGLSELNEPPSWHDHVEYRIKPKTWMHNGGEYPAPCTDPKEIESADYVYRPSYKYCSDKEYWKPGYNTTQAGFTLSSQALAASEIYHLTKEAAIEHARVLFCQDD
jgi:hypothetical protein